MHTWKTFAVAAILAAIAGTADAVPVPQGTKPPTTPPPTLLPVAQVDLERGEASFEHSVQVAVPIQVTRVIERDGRKETVTLTEYRTQYKVEVVAFGLKTYDLFTADGKPLPAKEAARQVVPGAVLLLCSEGGLPEPAYLKLFKPETVLLVPKKRGEARPVRTPEKDAPRP